MKFKDSQGQICFIEKAKGENIPSCVLGIESNGDEEKDHMILTQKQVGKLLPVLQKFIYTGDIK